jgi:ABC-type transport system involved in multi-copper enzyme maturation permease subunit
MTAVALTHPYGLARADLLKLRRRYGLIAVVGGLTIGAQLLTYAILALLHVFNPAHHGPAGGLVNFGHGMFLMASLGAVAGIIVGSGAGADDLTSGVFRELVVTGRSRLALFASRIPGGLAFLLPFVAVAYTATAVISSYANGSLPTPSVSLMATTGVWILAATAFSFLLGLGVASLTGSRAYSIGILLAWQLAVGRILLSITAFGVGRELVPESALVRLVPHAIRDDVSPGNPIPMSVAAAIAVLAVWTLIALGLGAWRTVKREA